MRYWQVILICACLLIAIPNGVAGAQSAVKTGKERLGEKANDEQRVDNCKVPPERWGNTPRSPSCGHAGEAGISH